MLNVHSSYSFRYGVNDPDVLSEWSISSGYDRIALTDINNTSAVLNFVRLVQKQGRTPVAGIDFRNGIHCCYVGIARNNEGFHELSAFLSRHLASGEPFPDRAPDFQHSFIIYPWTQAPKVLRPYERAGIASHELNRFLLHKPASTDRFVVLEPMSFFSKKQFNTHRLLRAIDCNCLLSRLGKDQQTREDERFLAREELFSRFSEFPEILSNTEALLSECSLHFAFGDAVISQNQATYTGSKDGDRDKIQELCEKSIPQRYGEQTQQISERVAMELDIIYQKDYLSYFLIAWDIIRYAKEKGYFHVGRGSGANSIIAYLLGITDVDPLELDLYFERFINLYRKNPPDFDIDFSWRDRDDVTRYIFERFPNSALLCTYSTFQRRATIRELGKVFGLPKSDLDLLTDKRTTPEQIDEMGWLVLKYSKEIAGLPSHLSIHAGGIIISEKPVTWFGATSLPPKGYPTTQFSMMEAEDVGLYKFDILSQRGLGKIRDSLEIIAGNQPDNPPSDVHDVKRFMKDERVNDLLRQARAIGCFYVESPAMRMLMVKLQTNNYLELVAASSIIRPGVAQSGMMREYIIRHREPEKRKDAHPVLLEIMPDTYGVMVYQEDVIKVAHHFAGLNLAESDILRRGMSGKFRTRNEFQQVRERFYGNCLAKGYSLPDINSVWNQIESFAGFSFSKGHSASYAVESYQTLYLKAYYPLEYMVATINNYGGYYRTEIYVHELRKLGGIVESPCINRGREATTIHGKVVYLGFQHVNGIELKTISAIIRERETNGVFTDFDNLVRRVPIPLEQLLLIIRAGGMRCFGIAKRALLWQAHFFHSGSKQQAGIPQLFAEPSKTFELPELKETAKEQAFEQIELLDFPLCSPFELLYEGFEFLPHCKARDLDRYVNREILTYGYLVALKDTETQVKKEAMLFTTFLDMDGDFLDTVSFPAIAVRFPFSGGGVYEIRGKVTREYDFNTIEISSVKKISYCEDPRYVDEK